MLDPFLSHELAVGRDHRGQRVVLVRVERDIFHRRRLLSRLNTAECLPRTRYPRRARRRSAYIPSTGSEPVFTVRHALVVLGSRSWKTLTQQTAPRDSNSTLV